MTFRNQTNTQIRIRWAMRQFGIEKMEFNAAVHFMAKKLSVSMSRKQGRNQRRLAKAICKQMRCPSLTVLFAASPAQPLPIETEVKAFYESWEWKRARYDYIKNKDRRCECCGSTPVDGVRIVVDHIKPIRHYWHLRLDPTNFQMLCDDCNMGKGSRDETDWRSSTGGNVVEFPSVASQVK